MPQGLPDFALLMPYMPLIIAAVGLAIGSFITAISYRMPRDLPWVSAASHCPKCENKLKVRDLVPLFSWLVSRGKCRHCESRVHWRYPLTELLTAISLVVLYFYMGETMDTNYLLMAGLTVCIIALTVTDLEHYMIPDELQIAMALLGLAYGLFVSQIGIEAMLKGAALGFAIGSALHYGYYFYKGVHGLGFGDVKLMAVAGVWLGFEPVVPFLFYGGILGIISAIIWRVLSRGRHFPFGPALAFSLLLILLYPRANYLFWNAHELF